MQISYVLESYTYLGDVPFIMHADHDAEQRMLVRTQLKVWTAIRSKYAIACGTVDADQVGWRVQFHIERVHVQSRAMEQVQRENPHVPHCERRPCPCAKAYDRYF